MILAEQELAIDRARRPRVLVLDASGVRWLLDGEDAARTGHAAGGGAADLDGGARARDHPQPPRLPRASTGSRASCTPPPAPRSRPRRGARTPAAPDRYGGATRQARAVLTVEVRCPELCPRFTARVFENVTIAPSPPWLKARLSAAGQRPINNVVDITNYVMLLTGQPLHAFDLDRVAGGAPRRCAARRRRAGADARRADAHARRRDGRDRGRRGAHLDRRADGRRALGGGGGHHARAAGGRHLERPQHPPHLLGAGAAQRGLRALREGPRPRAVHATRRRSPRA